MVKKTLGRRKIEMKEIADQSSKNVTFSKRRSGLMKKACELSTLCKVDIAILVISMSGTLYPFGSSNFRSVIDRFLNDDPNEEDGHENNPDLKILYDKLDELNEHLMREKHRKDELQKNMTNGGFDIALHQVNIIQLGEMNRSLVETKKKVIERMKQLSQGSFSLHGDSTSTIPSDWLKL